jgi:hypothetical protein
MLLELSSTPVPLGCRLILEVAPDSDAVAKRIADRSAT